MLQKKRLVMSVIRKLEPVQIQWCPPEEKPLNCVDELTMTFRTLLVVLKNKDFREGEHPVKFGHYIPSLDVWRIFGSPSDWKIFCWAELPKFPVDFSCRSCGADCPVAPDFPGQAVCENCCPDHEYEYDAMQRESFCAHCYKERPSE